MQIWQPEELELSYGIGESDFDEGKWKILQQARPAMPVDWAFLLNGYLQLMKESGL